jgi:Tfp pilus assembly protein PilX
MKLLLMQDKDRQAGSALVIVLLVLVTLTSVGIMAIMTGTTEQEVAANDKFHKMAFCLADAATEMTSELVEQNVEERGFGASTTWGNGNVGIITGSFYLNEEDEDDPGTTDVDESLQNRPTDTNRDIEMLDTVNGDAYVRTYSNTVLSTGSALQIASGYEGKGKGVAGGGAQMIFDIRSLAEGPSRSVARVWMRWRHLI